MATDPTIRDAAELEQLRTRLDELERDAAERTARANAALAAAQDRSYWLDRWHLDLNALMRRPGASEARAALRALRAIYRLLYDARRRVREATIEGGDRVRNVRQTVARERATAQQLAGDSSEHKPGS
jgi:hypothetical protein